MLKTLKRMRLFDWKFLFLRNLLEIRYYFANYLFTILKPPHNRNVIFRIPTLVFSTFLYNINLHSHCHIIFFKKSSKETAACA